MADKDDDKQNDKQTGESGESAASQNPSKSKTGDKKKKKAQNAPKVDLAAKSKEHKPTADEPDEFVAGVKSWADRLRPHALKIGLLVGVFVVATIGITTYQWMNKRKAMKATDAFAAAVQLSKRDVVVPTDDPDTDPPATTDVDVAPFPSLMARGGAVVNALSNAGAVPIAASLVRGDAQMELQKFDEAARSYAAAAKGLPAEAAVNARASIGYAFEAKAEATEDAAAREAVLGEALSAFKAMQPDEDGVSRDAAIFHEARILAVMGKRDEAKAAFQKLLDNHADSSLRDDAEIRLEALGGN